MKLNTLYVEAIGILLTASLLCSACSTQETGKQSISATGAAVLTPSGVESELPDDIEDEEIKQKKTTKKDKDGRAGFRPAHCPRPPQRYGRFHPFRQQGTAGPARPHRHPPGRVG